MALSAVRVRSEKRAGRYADGNGLYLFVQRSGARVWTFRFTRRGKAREAGLGRVEDVALAEARDRARECRRLLAQGIDPIEHRRVEVAEKAAKEGMTFEQVAAFYLAAHEASWRNEKHRWQWRNTLDRHVLPEIGKKPVGEVAVGDVMKIIEPLWQRMPETASRVRGRIEAVLDYASARGWRDKDNPARWKGHLANLLPARSKVRPVQHHPALPWREIGAFMVELRKRQGTSAQALEFAILTAARSGEVCGMRWAEIDLAHKVWNVPAQRMKAAREHRVPLSDRAIEILQDVKPLRKAADALVFPGGRMHRPLSDMALTVLLRRLREGVRVHGFRSTFRDWCAEATVFPSEVAEQALAHAIESKVEAAYQRGDLLEKRVRLMEAWSAFCATPLAAGEVVPMKKAAQ